MTTSKNSVLKDVVAYVDVWSSDKTANFSKPFVQQLQEMGAQVSKTFNKNVTHVVFNNGHSATWRKAKKSDVRLVSVLWISRCYDDAVHVDEELFPALNDESNPVLKNKKHRCMQPKDTPEERTPESERRMRKKLDKMMKDLAPKQPLVADVSPIIIDEDNGIVYSPSLKRSDYMAQRLRDMRDKHENLSPTASQMIESCSPSGVKPSLGNTPTHFKLLYDGSDDDSCASVAESGYTPHEEVRTPVDHREQGHKNSSEKPWLSPCHHVPTRISGPSKYPDFAYKEDEEGNMQKKSRRTSLSKKIAEKVSGLLEVPCQDKRSAISKRLSSIKSSSLSPNKCKKGKQAINTAKSFTDTKIYACSDAVNSSSVPSSVVFGDAAAEAPSKMEKRISKRDGLSLSTLVRSFSLSGGSKSVALPSADADDNVFEDYFSPSNYHQRSVRPLLTNLDLKSDIQIPFELNPVPKRKGLKKSKSIGSEMNSINCVSVLATRRRQSTLPFKGTSTKKSEAVKKRRASTSVQPTLTEANSVTEVQRSVSLLSHVLESRGNEGTVAAALNEISSAAEENHKGQGHCSLQTMVNKTKLMRTLVMTSMPTEKQHTVVQVVKALGGFSIVDRVCESTTHVVSGGQQRTLNVLLGIARGCWILSFEWILWCLEQRQWIPEEPYELSDQFPAAQICRLQRHLSAGEHQQDLFQDQPVIFVSQHSQPPTDSLVELIKLCGGTVCKTVRQAGLCIGKYNGRRPDGNRILSEQWVLDSITHLKKLPYDNYELE